MKFTREALWEAIADGTLEEKLTAFDNAHRPGLVAFLRSPLPVSQAEQVRAALKDMDTFLAFWRAQNTAFYSSPDGKTILALRNEISSLQNQISESNAQARILECYARSRGYIA
jgi:hypothetical protein